jgi:hypothetical protein
LVAWLDGRFGRALTKSRLVKASQSWSKLVKAGQTKMKNIFYEYAPASRADGTVLFKQHQLKRPPQPLIMEEAEGAIKRHFGKTNPFWISLKIGSSGS